MKLFGKWETEVEIRDRSLERYINTSPVIHTMGKHADKKFEKSNVSIVERLINKLMRKNETGNKQKTTKIVKEAFEKLENNTGENPVQLLVRAIENAGPREETVTLTYGGISVPEAVDASPQRRVDEALKFIVEAVEQGSHKSKKSASEVLAEEINKAAEYDVECHAVKMKEETERVAEAAR